MTNNQKQIELYESFDKNQNYSGLFKDIDYHNLKLGLVFRSEKSSILVKDYMEDNNLDVCAIFGDDTYSVVADLFEIKKESVQIKISDGVTATVGNYFGVKIASFSKNLQNLTEAEVTAIQKAFEEII